MLRDTAVAYVITMLQSGPIEDCSDCRELDFRMGKECKAKISVGTKSATSTVLLEGTDIIVRGELRGTWNVKDMKSLAAKGGKLTFSCDAGKVTIELGEQATVWLEALRNPQTRAQKLGIETGTTVCVLGDDDGEDLFDIERVSGKAISRRMSKSTDVVLLFTLNEAGLNRIPSIAKSMQDSCSVWVLWPKGVKGYGHEQVVALLKQFGLSQTRSIGFSEVFSGLRFVKSKSK